MTVDIQPLDFNVNLTKAILWQYDSAENLKALIAQKQAWYDENQKTFWENWIRDVFDMRTANLFGLNVWAIILGVPIYINNGPDQLSRLVFGFGEPHANFERGNFASQSGNSFPLNIETARAFLQLRYLQLTTAGCIPEINRGMKHIFQDFGPVWLNDGYNMTQSYSFSFPVTSELRYMFQNYDALPRPAGVGTDYTVNTSPTWGYGQYHENYDNGNFEQA